MRRPELRVAICDIHFIVQLPLNKLSVTDWLRLHRIRESFLHARLDQGLGTAM